MAVNIPGIVTVVVFYLIILAIGLWAGRKAAGSKSISEVLLADRRMGFILSVFTITATWVGGGYINGSAEIMVLRGLLWTQAPVGYSIALIVCGIFFNDKMRKGNYLTMFDPFQEKYGVRVGALMCIPQFIADLFWTAAILSALGATVHIILDLDETMSIIVSAIIAVFYTFLGGLWSVAYTDVAQLLCLAIFLTISCPFTLTHPAVNLSSIQDTWRGTIAVSEIGIFVDYYMLTIFGGTTWQEMYQRVLACKTSKQAKTATIISGVLCLLLSLPPVAIGVAGSAADWNLTEYKGEIPIPDKKMEFILPLALQYLCPLPVAVIGLAAVSASVMSSTDSSVLVTASVFTNNVYKCLIRQKASQREMLWVMRLTIVVAGAAACILAIISTSVYSLFLLCSDLMYVILFPQFVFVMYVKRTNAYGALLGFLLGFFLRLGAGEPVLGIPTFIYFPYYSEAGGQLFPFRTFIVITTYLVIFVVSLATDVLFSRGIIPPKFDFLQCVTPTLVEDKHGEMGEEMIPKVDIRKSL